MVTRHVKTAAAPVAKSPLPAPSQPVAAPESIEDAVRDVLGRHLDDAGDVDGYIAYINRKAPVFREAIMRSIANHPTGHEFNAVMAVVEDTSNPSFGVLALDDPEFIIEFARSSEGNLPQKTTPKNFSGAVMVMDQAFRDLFRGSEVSVDDAAVVARYAPLLRAGAVTKTIGLDERSPSAFDKIDQIRHVSDNIDTFVRHVGSLRRIPEAPTAAGLDSHALLDICAVLDADPSAEDALIKYVSERQRFDMDEFRDILAGSSRSLSDGTL
jgi:hypothetical protein